MTREQRIELREKSRLTRDLHRKKLESQYPKFGPGTRDLLWDMAWEEGHGNGLDEVSIWYHEYARLVTVAIEEERGEQNDQARASISYNTTRVAKFQGAKPWVH